MTAIAFCIGAVFGAVVSSAAIFVLVIVMKEK